jgi:hypothetical protein
MLLLERMDVVVAEEDGNDSLGERGTLGKAIHHQIIIKHSCGWNGVYGLSQFPFP